MKAQQTAIPLNDTVVIFLHRDDTQAGVSHVVQVTLKAAARYVSTANKI